MHRGRHDSGLAGPTCTGRAGAFVVAATDQEGILATTGYVGSWSAPIRAKLALVTRAP